MERNKHPLRADPLSAISRDRRGCRMWREERAGTARPELGRREEALLESEGGHGAGNRTNGRRNRRKEDMIEREKEKD